MSKVPLYGPWIHFRVINKGCLYSAVRVDQYLNAGGGHMPRQEFTAKFKRINLEV